MDWRLFASVFLVIFLAELPDKSTLTAIFLSSRYPARGVFIGAASALILQSLIAVVLGTVVMQFLSRRIVHLVSGVIFLCAGVLLWRRKEETEQGLPETAKAGEGDFRRAILTAFGLVFAAEWGDITQLTTAAFAAKYQAPATVFAAAALAECSASALGIFLGNSLKKALPPKLVQKLAAAVFAGVGIYLLTA